MNKISHDDAVSYVAATGHEGDYYRDKKAVVGRWIEANQLKSYRSIGDRFDFVQIKNDLVDHDIHPPLYFWLLHIWLLITGTGPFAGPLLNCLIFACTAVLVYQFVCRGTGDRVPAATACAVLAASPVALDITMATRQYELLMFLSTALFFFGYEFSRKGPGSRIDYLLFGLLCTLGMLTHYYFVFPIASVLLLVFYYEKRITRKLTSTLASLTAAIAVFLFVMPGVFHQFAAQQSYGQSFEWQHVPDRLSRIVRVMTYFFGWAPSWPLWLGLAVPLALFSTCLAYVYSQNTPRLAAGSSAIRLTTSPGKTTFDSRAKHTGASFERIVWYFLFFNAGIVFFLYSAQVASSHAMASRYIASFVPLVAIVIALTISRLRFNKAWPVAAMVLLLSINAVSLFIQTRQTQIEAGTLANAKRVVLDSPARGVLFRDLIGISSNAQVYVAWRRDLIEHESPWNSRLNKGDLVILDNGFGNRSVPESLIKEQVAARHHISKPSPNEIKIGNPIATAPRQAAEYFVNQENLWAPSRRNTPIPER